MKFCKCASWLLMAGLVLLAGCGKENPTPTVESIIADTNLVAEVPAPVEETAEDTNIVLNLAEIEAENRAKVERALESATTLLQQEKLAQAARALQEVSQLPMTSEQQEQVKTLQAEIQRAMMAKVSVSGPMSEQISNLLQKAASDGNQ